MDEARRADPWTPQVGNYLGPYRLIELLAVGGMGLVFKAYEEALDRHVAIKVLAPQQARDPGAARRFLEEPHTLANLSHPNIVHVYTAGHQYGVVYFAMELVDGDHLETLLADHKRLPPREAVELIRQAAAGLQYAYQHEVVHGDVKPGNLMLTHAGVIKVTDFGLARRLQTSPPLGGGEVFGTPEYVSPEVIEGTPGDQRSDIYSLGGTLYRMLTGHPPFTGASPEAIMQQHLSAPPTPIPERNPKVPAATCQVVARMMARHPADRYQDYQELILALES